MRTAMKQLYEHRTYKVVYYAETGWDSGDERGFWSTTETSVPFPTKELADKYLTDRGWKLSYGTIYRNPSAKYGYAIARVRIAEEIVKYQNT